MFPSDPPPPRSQRSGLHLPSVFPRSLAYHPRPVGLESSLKPRKPFEVAIWPCTLLDPFVIGTLDPCPSHKEDTWLLACAWEGTFAFVGFRRSSGPKGVPDPESPRGTRSCLSTWNLGVAFPGHPSHPPPRHFTPQTQARLPSSHRLRQLGNFARISSAKADGPFKGRPAYLCSACPARFPSPAAAADSARVPVVASRLPPSAAALPGLGPLPRAPRPAGVPTRDPGSSRLWKGERFSPKEAAT